MRPKLARGPRTGLNMPRICPLNAKKCRHLKYQPTMAASAVVVQTFFNLFININKHDECMRTKKIDNTSKPKTPALFLDRDGVVNIDYGYIYRKENIEFIDGIFSLCKKARNFGYLICIITNQSGIGRGYYSEQDFFVLTDWMREIFHSNGAAIDKVYFCPTHPEHGIGKYRIKSPSRKPEPGMILQAVDDFGIDLATSILVGDKETDIQAGIAAGIGCNLLYNTHKPINNNLSAATAVVKKLTEVVRFLISHNS